MPFLLRENRIRLRRRDRQRPLDIAQLGLLDKRRVSTIPDVELLGFGEEVPNDIFRAEAVSYAADFLAVVLGAHGDEAGVDDGVDGGWGVGGFFFGGLVGALEPGLDVEVAGAVEGDGVAVEEVGHHDEVAVCGELVGLDGEGGVSREGRSATGGWLGLGAAARVEKGGIGWT